MEIKKYATQFLPEWTKSVPFQIKGNSIKEACAAFWASKGRPKFRTRKSTTQSCYITKSAISDKGIYPRKSGKGLVIKEILPAKLCDSRLIWRNGSWYLGACYTFRKRLEWIALKKGCCVVMNTEEYTSKTHPQTGVVNRKLGSAKTIKLTNGSRACRDVVGAYNFMLKTLVVDTPTFD